MNNGPAVPRTALPNHCIGRRFVLSLVFVGLQVKQNTPALQARRGLARAQRRELLLEALNSGAFAPARRRRRSCPVAAPLRDAPGNHIPSRRKTHYSESDLPSEPGAVR